MNEMSNHKKEEEEAESVFYMTKPTRWINGRVHIVSCRHNFFLPVLYNALVLFGGRKKQKQSHPFSPTFTTTTTTKIFFSRVTLTFDTNRLDNLKIHCVCSFDELFFLIDGLQTTAISIAVHSGFLIIIWIFSFLFLHDFFSCSLWKWEKGRTGRHNCNFTLKSCKLFDIN